MIKEKRDSLERFIREQTIGPGINGYRFVDLENEALQTFLNYTLSNIQMKLLTSYPQLFMGRGFCSRMK
jgi:hypothetical protein